MRRLASLIPTIRRNRKRIPDSPRLLTYLVTFRCNMRCIMCDSWKKRADDDLTMDEIQSIFRQLPQMDAVRLSGGEPFLRPDLPDIARVVRTSLNPCILHVTTNGVLTDRIIRFCETRPKDALLYLLVSLDGIGETHDAIRGRRNVWERAVETIKAVAPRQKAWRVQLGINQTIVNEAGLADYGRLRDYLKPFGVYHNVVFGYDESATYHTAEEISIQHDSAAEFNPFGQFDETRLQSFFSVIRKDLATHSALNRLAKRYYLNGIENRLLHRTGFPNPMCVALSSHMRLLPDGSLPTCQFNSTIVGNLRRQEFNQIWFSEAIGRQRDWINKCRGCWAECEILPNAIYTGDVVGLMRRRSYIHNDFNPNPDKTEAKRKRTITKAR